VGELVAAATAALSRPSPSLSWPTPQEITIIVHCPTSRSETLQKPPTKAQLRAELESAVDDYLAHGGKIELIGRGVSGRDDHQQLQKPLFTEPKASRTLVNDLIARIESRRRPPRRPATKRATGTRPRMKTLYDDFGEPIRKIWVDE